VQPDVVNLLTVFMVAVWAVFDYFTGGFSNNAIKVDSYHFLIAGTS